MANEERHSDADIPPLLTDEEEIAEREAANALLQYDAMDAEILTAVERERSYRIRPSMIQALHRIAMDGIDSYAENWRPGSVKITKSRHKPPHASTVAVHIEEMCDYINSSWDDVSPVELAAYTLWRICWIHPFTDGNGRTARAVSYLVLCAALKTKLPGRETVPEFISNNKTPYYEALEAADDALAEGKNEAGAVKILSEYISDLLAKQLLEIHQKATN